MRLRRRRVDTEIEKKILTGLIVSSEYGKSVLPLIDLNFFQLDFVRPVIGWIKGYYDRYLEAPKENIQYLFDIEKGSLGPEDTDLIRDFLSGLSSQFEREGVFNGKILYDKTIEYFTERHLVHTANTILVAVGAGKLPLAQKTVQNYKQIASKMSGWVDPFSEKMIENVYETKFQKSEDEEGQDFLFRFPGKIGRLLGGFERGWLVGFLGPMKRGKTWILQEVSLQSIVAKLNVVFISIEMSEEGTASRTYKRVAAYPKDEGEVDYPIFVCLRGMNNSCQLPFREEQSCTYCRNHPEHYKEFVPWVGFEKVVKRKLPLRELKEKVSSFTATFGGQYRLKSYPAYTATLQQIERDLDNLEYTEDFVPDVIVIDYADIIAPEDTRLDSRGRLDDIWKKLKGLAQKKHALVVTASQSNRVSIKKRTVEDVDTSDDIRKLAHVDAMFSLNQTPVEKDLGVLRVGVVAHRWKEFSKKAEVALLQKLSDGQVLLDSEYVGYGFLKKEEREEKADDAIGV